MDSGICEKRLRATLEKFGGVLKYGKHGAESGECCALELLAEDMGLGHTDSPRDTHTWDLRSLNDMNVPDDVRTEHLIPVLAAYAGSMDWDVKRQMEVSEKVLLGMFRKVIAQYIDDPKTKQQFADVHSVDTMIEACNDLARAREVRHVFPRCKFHQLRQRQRTIHHQQPSVLGFCAPCDARSCKSRQAAAAILLRRLRFCFWRKEKLRRTTI